MANRAAVVETRMPWMESVSSGRAIDVVASASNARL
jgi:hypothetical protein